MSVFSDKKDCFYLFITHFINGHIGSRNSLMEEMISTELYVPLGEEEEMIYFMTYLT